MVSVTRIQIILCLFSVTCGGVCAKAQTIQRVDVQQDTEAPLASVQGVQERRLTKFMDEWTPVAEAVIDVYWEASAQGLRAPVTVVIEYHQAYRREAGVLKVEYPQQTRGPQIARFRVNAAQVERHGPVTAWRVRVLEGVRAVDERVEGRWSNGGQHGGRR